jgi:long-chain acyl-CoA synthetase
VSADVAARLRETARRAPDRVALVWQDQTVTYGELDHRVDLAAAGFQHLGVRPGDRVAVVLGNVPQFVEAYFGALRAGATVVPLTLGLAPTRSPTPCRTAVRPCWWSRRSSPT